MTNNDHDLLTNVAMDSLKDREKVPILIAKGRHISAAEQGHQVVDGGRF